MILPEKIQEIFERESSDLKFGKISVSLVIRGSHFHYEIEKFYTIKPDEDPEIKLIEGEENG
jgi:hypothetical protein